MDFVTVDVMAVWMDLKGSMKDSYLVDNLESCLVVWTVRLWAAVSVCDLE